MFKGSSLAELEALDSVNKFPLKRLHVGARITTNKMVADSTCSCGMGYFKQASSPTPEAPTFTVASLVVGYLDLHRGPDPLTLLTKPFGLDFLGCLFGLELWV